jgi:broad specificity phosphatase PhoE
MTSFLESIKWCKPALSLLSQCPELDPNRSAIFHLRHTERPLAAQNDFEQHAQLLSTKRGKQAAYELGKHLPNNREYRLYNSYSPRAKETVEKIHEGILSQGVNSRIEGVFYHGPNDNSEKKWSYYRRDIPEPDSVEGRRQLFINRVNGSYPPWEVEPGSIIAKRQAAIIVENLKNSQENSFNLYVSHDVVIASFMFHWFGIIVDESFVDFLDGFILQLYEKTMVVYTKNGKKEVYYPGKYKLIIKIISTSARM